MKQFVWSITFIPDPFNGRIPYRPNNTIELIEYLAYTAEIIDDELSLMITYNWQEPTVDLLLF